jgi:hypothetical protein
MDAAMDDPQIERIEGRRPARSRPLPLPGCSFSARAVRVRRLGPTFPYFSCHNESLVMKINSSRDWALNVFLGTFEQCTVAPPQHRSKLSPQTPSLLAAAHLFEPVLKMRVRSALLALSIEQPTAPNALTPIINGCNNRLKSLNLLCRSPHPPRADPPPHTRLNLRLAPRRRKPTYA